MERYRSLQVNTVPRLYEDPFTSRVCEEDRGRRGLDPQDPDQTAPVDGVLGAAVMTYFSQRCPQLDTVTWKHTPGYVSIAFWADMKRTMAVWNENETDRDNTSSTTNHRRKDDFLLYKACTRTVLEQVSLRQATVYNDAEADEDGSTAGPIRQSILMKFVRRAPSTLLWSDLSFENMQRLRLERPGIDLVNWQKQEKKKKWSSHRNILYHTITKSHSVGTLQRH